MLVVGLLCYDVDKQHRLYFIPLPQEHNEFLLTLGLSLTTGMLGGLRSLHFL